MKKYILSIILFVAVATSTFALTGKQQTPEQRARWLTENVTSFVVVTPEQKLKIYALAVERVSATDAEKAAAGEGFKEYGESMRAIGRKFDEGVKALLTTEQIAEMKTNKDAAKAKKAAGGK